MKIGELRGHSHALVSVIIPTYNRKALLAEALQSVLDQTHRSIEVFVVDDGSTDGTDELIRGLARDEIRYIRQEHGGYPGAARNAGLKLARGDFIAFLDSDDRWLPSKTAVQLTTLKNNEDLDFVASDYFTFPAQRSGPSIGLAQPKILWLRDLLRHNPVANSSVLIRKDAVDAVGLQDESLATCEDYEYWLRVLERRDGSGMIIPRPLFMYRRHDGNLGVQGVDQCDRLSAIVAGHRGFDAEYVDRLLEDLKYLKEYRQTLIDIDSGRTSLGRALSNPRVRVADRLRILKRRMEKRAGRPVRRD